MQERKERTGADLIRHIYATQLELEAWKKISRTHPANRVAEKTIATLAYNLRQGLIDYIIARNAKRVNVGQVVLSTYKIGDVPERPHAFSRNKIVFLFPIPVKSGQGITFAVEERLSSLRRRGDFSNSLRVYHDLAHLIRPTDHVQERQPVFVARTVDEIFAIDATIADIMEVNPRDPTITHLRGVQGYLMIGRLLALTQHERVPGLQVLTVGRDNNIDVGGTWGTTQLPSLTFPRASRMPTESVVALTTAGVI